MIHELKIMPDYFEAVVIGAKTFELINDDRGFQIRDILILKEWDPDAEEFTGREVVRRICYVLKRVPGLTSGYAILGIEEGSE
ncbi:hypothetical protein A3206_07980 [Candidatus Methanomassiliicoccus intestinalis]|jgi:hypothetical protein|uniref:DUF3850 domain-containing protein n=1 Tax=Methanomassiliicoccus intestinalis (strain Issoire-Mx1) TaxID=1295009 RepID=R9TBY5_METII|nr:ASCH/PUA domain-containing protein [Candidatus Methanomassiliicoccus intestinalis]AGN26963.1 hypothetical protein MMINT_16700 [Candidatus Methanomassiliicoccus intestinalis Issoire-Mx1]TQS79134.1 MAG: hypothetical protein A3206_07980 [Candidatus Methanomassiliicoccus intestinalis]